MKTIFGTALCLFIGVFNVAAAPLDEIILWPEGAPGSEGKTNSLVVITNAQSGERSIYQVHKPTITPFLPATPAAGRKATAVIVIPGGGHRVLAYDHEGDFVGKTLSERGMAGFVLKYRLARETNSTYTIMDHALADTQRAIRTIRSRAAEFGIDPNRIGVMGFSAGGELANHASLHYDEGKPDAADPIDRISSKPNFQALIYPGRSEQIQPTANTPPAFLAAGYKDRKDISEGLAEAYLRFKRANVPAELHIYSGANHGFGHRPSRMGSPSSAWLVRFEEWLADSNLLAK
jgi:acetyl esterase/lipase